MRKDREFSAGQRVAGMFLLTFLAWIPVPYLLFQRLLIYGNCDDIQGDIDSQETCDGYARNLSSGVRVLLFVAAASFLGMVPVGVREGLRRRPVSAGPAGPLVVLVVGSPAAYGGYLLGWLAGRILRGSVRRRSASEKRE
jgi:hypothetical protein